MTHTTIERAGVTSLTRDLIALTKPRIISLLLVTTIAPMFVAGSGLVCVPHPLPETRAEP